MRSATNSSTLASSARFIASARASVSGFVVFRPVQSVQAMPAGGGGGAAGGSHLVCSFPPNASDKLDQGGVGARRYRLLGALFFHVALLCTCRLQTREREALARFFSLIDGNSLHASTLSRLSPFSRRKPPLVRVIYRGVTGARKLSVEGTQAYPPF